MSSLVKLPLNGFGLQFTTDLTKENVLKWQLSYIYLVQKYRLTGRYLNKEDQNAEAMSENLFTTSSLIKEGTIFTNL